MLRALAYAGACALTLALSSPAAADSIEIRSGSATLNWDSSLAGLGVSSADSQFASEHRAGPVTGFPGGATVDFSTTIPFTNGGNRGLPATYRGQQYPQTWLSGSMSIVAQTFVAPHVNGNGSTFQTFTTTFTMTGSVAAWPTVARTGTPLFTTRLSGGGTISATYRIVDDSYVMNDGGGIFTFAPTPDPQLPAPWKSGDVGAVGLGGYAYQGSDGDLFLGGAGSDIWGTADSFRFVYQPFDGDGDISAIVEAETNTNPFAKIGLMLRQSVDPSSPHVVFDVRPDGSLEFMTRSAGGGATTFIAGGSVPVTSNGRAVLISGTLKLVRNGATVTALVCGGTCRTIGSTQWIAGPVLAGAAITSLDPTTVNDGMFAANLPTVHRLPPPWTFTDVGVVGQRGSATASNGVFTVNAAGSDIWGTADSFGAVANSLSGDVTFVARVVSEMNTHTFAKAGLEIGMLNPNSARVILDVKPDGGVEFMARLADGSAMSYLAGAAGPFPMWLRLMRSGDRVEAATSPTGQSWTTVGSVSIALPPAAPAALVVTSHDPTVLNTAAFDNVSLTAGAPAAASDIVVWAGDVPDASLHGSWSKASDPTSPQGVKLVTSDTGFASDALASPTHYVDVTFNAQAGTPYTLWLRLQAAANSKFNDSVWVQFSDALAGGAPVYAIGSPNALLVNLATDSAATSLRGWGWQNTAYWLSQATTVSFAASGAHMLRIQVREDGVQLDQILLSPVRFRTSAPGAISGDTTVVSK